MSLLLLFSEPALLPTVVGGFATTAGATATATPAFTLPTVQTGDVVMFEVTVNSGVALFTTPPAGWTLIEGPVLNSTNSLRSWLYQKTLTAAESGTTVTTTMDVATRWTVTGVVVHATDGANVAVSFLDNTDDLALSIPPVTPAVPNTLLVTLAGIRYNTTTIGVAAAGGWTELAEAVTTNATAPLFGSWVGAKDNPGGAGVATTASDQTFAGLARANGWALAFAYAEPAAPPAVVTGTGSWGFSGSGTVTRTPKVSGTGGWSFAGSGIVSRTPKITGTGAWTFAGSATRTRTPKLSGLGAWAFAGSAVRTRTSKITGTGSWGFTGTGAVSRTPRLSGLGAWAFAGTASRKRTPKLSGAGTWSFVSDATIKRVPRRTGTGLVSWSGAATATRAPRLSGAGSWGFAGSGSVTAPAVGVSEVFGTGEIAWHGSVAVSRASKVAGSGLVSWAGSATVSAPVVGAANLYGLGSWGFAGAVSIRRVPRRIGTGLVSWVGAATVSAPAVGGAAVVVGTGSWGFLGSASIRRVPRRIATGSIVWAGSATVVGGQPEQPPFTDFEITVGGFSRTEVTATLDRTRVTGSPARTVVTAVAEREQSTLLELVEV